MFREVMPKGKNQGMSAKVTSGMYLYLGVDIVNALRNNEVEPLYCNIYKDSDNLKLRFDFCDDGKYKFLKNSDNVGTVSIRAAHTGLKPGDVIPCTVEGSYCDFDYSNVDLTTKDTKVS